MTTERNDDTVFKAGRFYKKEVTVLINGKLTAKTTYGYQARAILETTESVNIDNVHPRAIFLMGGYQGRIAGISGIYIINADARGEYVDIKPKGPRQPYGIRLYASDLDDDENANGGIE